MNESEIYQRAVQLVANARGKLEVCCKVGASNLEELSIAYTPGVAEPTRAVQKDKALQYQYTAKASMLAIVTDGTAVLGLGNVGPEAAMVVMEGKGVMLKHFANADPPCRSASTPRTRKKSYARSKTSNLPSALFFLKTSPRRDALK